jgi:NAD+ synthase (glutamine-hydrolysing)
MKMGCENSMFDGYVRVAAATPEIRAADCQYNADQIIRLMERASREGAGLLCLPELCVTGYTCGDLFLQRTLLEQAREALRTLIQESAGRRLLVAAGLPLEYRAKLFNVAAVFGQGKLLGFVPKSFIPNDGEFYELRHFTPAPAETCMIPFDGRDIPMGARLLFQCEDIPAFTLAVEICEDLWTPAPPSDRHAMAGATMIVNLSASDETVGKPAYRRFLAAGQSARLVCAYAYADAGLGESSSDLVFSGHNLVCENGVVLAESRPFGEGWAISDVDMYALTHDRKRMNTFDARAGDYTRIPFSAESGLPALIRPIDPHPFVPHDEGEKGARCEDILSMQAAGLAQRIRHTGCKTAVVGVSGGLDSSLALLHCDAFWVKRS